MRKLTFQLLAYLFVLACIGALPADTMAAQSQPEYACGDEPVLADRDPNSDGILTLAELEDVAAQYPDIQDLQDAVEQIVAKGYAGVRYDGNCDVSDDDASLEARLIALETRVADLDARVEQLESRLDSLDGGAGAPVPPSNSSGEGSSAAGDVVEISGVSSTVSDDFQLHAGRYEVSVTVQSACCISVYLHGPSLDAELLFNEIFDFDGQGGTATDIFEVPETGEYFVDAQNVDGPWTVTFRKR